MLLNLNFDKSRTFLTMLVYKGFTVAIIYIKKTTFRKRQMMTFFKSYENMLMTLTKSEHSYGSNWFQQCKLKINSYKPPFHALGGRARVEEGQD